MNRAVNKNNRTIKTSTFKQLRLCSFGTFTKCVMVLCLIAFQGNISAQQLSREKITEIENFVNQYAKKEQKLAIGKIRVDSTYIDFKRRWVQIYANENCAYLSFNENTVKHLNDRIKDIISDEFPKYNCTLYADKQPINNYNHGHRKERFVNKVSKSLITPLRPYSIDKGLTNKHIALWQSHGWYYEQKLARWEWQRARIFQTVEDLYTQSFVLPYLVPMI